MENSSFENECESRKERVSVYENFHAPDVVIRQPITSQPRIGEPITAKPGDDVGYQTHKTADGSAEMNHGNSGCANSDKIYSVDAEQTSRDWSTDLFFSIRGNPHKKSSKDNAKRAICDCACVPCMMCSIAERLGDPRYLPFVPCTGTAVRFKVRILGGITGSICEDCMVTSFCWPCAVCQMHREMEDIGI
ncbi:hypothetical protein BaRGS_00016751 [Batillaria attramentaria]|uniref:Uncharacterized protein n=1 Tax=Batillaria attramentaria TaxID=370345 RepID=A0ABD0KZA0_9CAEN